MAEPERFLNPATGKPCRLWAGRARPLRARNHGCVMREASARNLSYAPASGRLHRLQVTDRQAIATGGSNVLREPTDPTGVVVIGVGEQLVLEGSQELADEGIMPVPGEGVVGEQQ